MPDRKLSIGQEGWQSSFEAKIRGQARLADFTHFRSVTTGSPRFVGGNHAFYIRDGRVQLAWILAAIRAARARVDLEMYIFEPDGTGVLVRDELVDAARRGVRVRVLWDSIGSSAGGPEFFEPIARAGGQVIEFNPAAPWRLRMSRLGKLQLWQPNSRDHRKVLVCDAPRAFVEHSARGFDPLPPEGSCEDDERTSLAIVGGRNIGDHYLGSELGAGQWRDCGAVLFGPVVPAIAAMFDAMWAHAEGPETSPPALSAAPVGELQILPLGSQPGFFNLIQWAISRLAGNVRSELRISCAYFIPSGRLRRALAGAARRTQRCLVLLPKVSDVPMVDSASRHLWGSLLRAGVKIHRYASNVLHEKTIVFDGVATIVGSSNLDPRSFRLNYELSVVILGASFAAPVVASHDADLERSEPYTLDDWRRRPWPQKLVDWFWSLLRSQL